MIVFINYITLFFLVFNAGKVLGLTCPDGWSSHGESCFLFKRETYNWFDAKSVCDTLDGYLAEAETPEKHQFLSEMVYTHDTVEDGVWLGVQDFAEEGFFVWPKSKQRAQTTQWGPGEPQDGSGEEDCVVLIRGGWSDVNCEDRKFRFICEKPASEDTVIG